MNFGMPVIPEVLCEMDEAEFVDVVSGDPRIFRSHQELEDISDTLYAAHVRLKGSQDSRINALQDFRKALPVYAKKEDILGKLRETFE